MVVDKNIMSHSESEVVVKPAIIKLNFHFICAERERDFSGGEVCSWWVLGIIARKYARVQNDRRVEIDRLAGS